MIEVQVINLSCTGHSGTECLDYECPCTVPRVKIADGGDGHSPEFNTELDHDENRCECSYEVNDATSAGTREAESTSHQDLYRILVPDYINETVEFDQLVFEPSGNNAVLVKDGDTTEPLYELRWK